MPQVLDLEVETMLAADAEAISRWRYPGPYALYDQPLARESESIQYMLDPHNGFHAVRGLSGLVGFCSFGMDGRVPGGTYDDDALDVGAGMDPTLVGSGYGRSFLDAVVEYATRELNAVRLRATIASWNARALRASRSAGFRPISTFRTDQGSEFAILLRDQSDVIIG
jgi:[ribosomal protein S18]-alanine N-acetyltransferase